MNMPLNKSKLEKTGLALVIIVFYYQWLVHFHIGIPCLFHEITGWLCPGCGITHMYLYMLHFDFKFAFYCNSFIFIIQPFIYYFILKLYICWLTDKKVIFHKFENIIIYCFIILAGLFFIYRNIQHIISIYNFFILTLFKK